MALQPNRPEPCVNTRYRPPHHIIQLTKLIAKLLHNSPNLSSGSLTTLLIAHITTLELGDHLEFYVTLTGLLIITGFFDGENTYFLVIFESYFLHFQRPSRTTRH